MGCPNSKLVPEGPASGQHVVEVLGSRSQTQNRSDRPRDPTKDPRATGPPPEGERQHRKVKKYRDKFDPRVTAKYDIKALIGRGNFSKVVRVEHKNTKQPYAIKMIDRLEGKEVFESEVAVLRRVKHTYIIQLIEVFESKDKVYMVMELATGGELFDRIIAKGSFSERDATRVLKMVLEGVNYLHGLGITHRDLKPENLLYYHPGHDSKIMITDFGLSASRKGTDQFMRTTCGTPEYIAPEIIARKPYNSQVDMWAIGVITYILLSGTMPFDDENKTRLYRLILKGKYSYVGEGWKEVTKEAKEFINKLLTVDPVERLTAAAALHNTWLTSLASNKNLHRTISQNYIHRMSTRANSTKSAKSTKSTKSNKSNRSGRSLRSEHRRVQPEEIDELHRNPEIQADLMSLGN